MNDLPHAACKCFICDELGGFLHEMAHISEVDTDMENVDSLPARKTVQ